MATRAHDSNNLQADVLVVDASPDRVASIRRWALDRADVRSQFVTTTSAALEVAARDQPQVAVVDLLFPERPGVALAIELARLAPDIEIVLIVDDPGAPEVQTAWDLGWERLVKSDGVAAWLNRGLLPLAHLATLKRQLSHARRDAERLAAGDALPRVPALPLAVAEARYRESYLRGAMAAAGGRREAARLAGVPYTTFCVMLRKLGIT